jgi:acetate kinase
MGFTPLDGVVMGTRSGAIDPAIVSFLMRKGMNDKQIDNILYKESGWKGICNMSNMYNVVQASNKKDKLASLTIDLFVNSVVKYILIYANEVNQKLDGIIFTGGIGENSDYLCSKIVNSLNLLNIKLNKASLKTDSKTLDNDFNDYKLISANDSKIKVYCMKTNEELEMVNEITQLLK